MSQLLDLLNNYQPDNEKEIDFKKQMINFLINNVDAFDRTNDVAHFTSSSWIVNKDNTKALLLHHKKLGFTVHLGGHCDGDGDTLRVALKEAHEESGIENIIAVNGNIFDIDIHKIPEYKGIPAHIHYDIRFLLQVTSDEEGIHNEESHDLLWIDKDINQLPNKFSGLIRMFNKW